MYIRLSLDLGTQGIRDEEKLGHIDTEEDESLDVEAALAEM